MKNWLQNNYVVLSGASGGIGRELTKILVCKYHAYVIGIGRSEEKMCSLVKELGELSPRFSYRLFDVSVKENWQTLAKELSQSSISPLLLINNAGTFPPLGRALNAPSEQIEEILKANFLSAVYATEALSPLLSQKKAGIVNVASSAALCPVAGSAAYSASKGALKGYTETLQLEEKGKRYVGIFYPGTTATDLFRADENVQRSAMRKIAASPQKMAKKLARKIYRRKKRAALGWDAKLMSFLTRIAPVKGPALVRRAMKSSKSVAFTDVFTE